jgi:putative membrane protein
MKRFMGCLILTLPLAAWGADKSPDQEFFKHAAEGGIAEVEAGNLAQDKGNSQAVKDFGVMMVKDHTDGNTKLQSLAASQGVALPTTEGAMHAASKAKLEVLRGNAFDKAYIKNQVAAHEQAVSVFKKEIATGTDAQVKSFAKETLPTLEAHLRKVRDIAAQAGVETK